LGLDIAHSHGLLLNILYWLFNILDRLFNILDLLDRLLNILDWLFNDLDFLLGLVNDLSFDGLVFNSFYGSFLGNIFNIFILIHLGDIFSLIFNGIVVGDLFFFGNIFSSLNSFIFHDRFFIGNIFNSGFSLDRLLLLDNGLLNVLDWLLNVLNGLLNWLSVCNWLRSNIRGSEGCSLRQVRGSGYIRASEGCSGGLR